MWPSDFPVRIWYNDRIRTPPQKKLKVDEDNAVQEEVQLNDQVEVRQPPRAPIKQYHSTGFKGLRQFPLQESDDSFDDSFDGNFFFPKLKCLVNFRKYQTLQMFVGFLPDLPSPSDNINIAGDSLAENSKASDGNSAAVCIVKKFFFYCSIVNISLCTKSS